jgi:hypothetical protein
VSVAQSAPIGSGAVAITALAGVPTDGTVLLLHGKAVASGAASVSVRSH